MDIEALIDQYYEAAIDGTSLVDFTRDAVEGRYGSPDPKVLNRFLDRIEVIVLGNIEVKLEEAPGSAEDAETAQAAFREELGQAREWVADLPHGA